LCVGPKYEAHQNSKDLCRDISDKVQFRPNDNILRSLVCQRAEKKSICAKFTTNCGSFIGHSKLYRYNDNLKSEDNAVQVDRFAVEKMPVMLIYNKFQS
jgi:hypothetical protein